MDERSQLFQFYSSKWPEIAEGLSKRDRLSMPLFIDPHERYFQAATKLMIVGQEANRWVEELPDGDTEKAVRRILSAYVSFDLGRTYRRSPFWQASWRLAQLVNPDEPDPFCFVWSNLVKTDRIKGQNRKGENIGTRPFQPDEEWISQFSLLQEEVRILKPDAIVFFVGPYYCDRLIKSYSGISFKPLTAGNPLQQVSHDALPARSFLTYHPNYLWRSKRRFVIDAIASHIKSNS